MLLESNDQFRGASSLSQVQTPACWTTRLAEMHRVHDQLLRAMSEMAAATNTPTPVRQQYAGARWRLSKAGNSYRALWAQLRPRILPHMDGKELDELASVDLSKAELRCLSSESLGRWSVETIDVNWPAYCEESRRIRWKLMALVRHEKRYIVPVLERLARVIALGR